MPGNPNPTTMAPTTKRLRTRASKPSQLAKGVPIRICAIVLRLSRLGCVNGTVTGPRKRCQAARACLATAPGVSCMPEAGMFIRPANASPIRPGLPRASIEPKAPRTQAPRGRRPPPPARPARPARSCGPAGERSRRRSPRPRAPRLVGVASTGRGRDRYLRGEALVQRGLQREPSRCAREEVSSRIYRSSAAMSGAGVAFSSPAPAPRSPSSLGGAGRCAAARARRPGY
jgi:hypothetical protein